MWSKCYTACNQTLKCIIGRIYSFKYKFIAIFIIPVTFYVVEKFNHKGEPKAPTETKTTEANDHA